MQSHNCLLASANPNHAVTRSPPSGRSMLTFFSTPKPFVGHIDVIQRNALQSWKQVHAGAEIILFGDDLGAKEVCSELNIRHEPHVPRNVHGTKYLAPIFDRAAELARYDVLCYVNCDIVLLADFLPALARLLQSRRRFLMVGQRRDLDVRQPLPFALSGWQEELRRRALREGKRRPPQWIDYFAFSQDLYRGKIPPFVIGRPSWDNWLIWYARRSGALVADATSVVTAVHQNHDYSYHRDGKTGVWQGAEARQNLALLENGRCFATIRNATHRLTRHGLQRNLAHYGVLMVRQLRGIVDSAWFGLLDLTRPIRHAIGLRKHGG